MARRARVLGEILIAVVQFLGELLLQLLAEALAESGLEAIREAVRPTKPNRPVVAAIGYALLGALFALLSLLIFPNSFARHTWLRIANLVIAPALVGWVLVAVGQWRAGRGQERLYLHRFSYGYLFALTFALVRFVFSGTATVGEGPAAPSQGHYRLPFADGTTVKVFDDFQTHRPVGREDLYGVGGNEPYRVVAAADGRVMAGHRQGGIEGRGLGQSRSIHRR